MTWRRLTIAPDADALDALSKMQRNGTTCLLVTEGDRLVGTIGLSDLLGFLNLKLDLEGADNDGADSAARRDRPRPEVAGER